MKRLHDTTLLVGDRVRYLPAYLDTTGQFTVTPGPEAPCHWGPRARGSVTVHERGRVQVLWDDGLETTVLTKYLERV